MERIAAKYAMLALVLFWALDQHMLAWDRVLTAEDACRVTYAWSASLLLQMKSLTSTCAFNSPRSASGFNG